MVGNDAERCWKGLLGNSPAPGPQLTFCFLCLHLGRAKQRVQQQWVSQVTLPPGYAGWESLWPVGKTETE